MLSRASKQWPYTLNILPKWRNFAKSDHTDPVSILNGIFGHLFLTHLKLQPNCRMCQRNIQKPLNLRVNNNLAQALGTKFSIEPCRESFDRWRCHRTILLEEEVN